MLPTRYSDDFYPPSSRGSSPPGTSYFDSSPLSSPGHVPIFESEDEDSTEERRPIDPLSGLYISRSGKRPAGCQAVSSPPMKKTRYSSPSTAITTPQSSPMDLLKDRESQIWEKAATYAYEDASSSKHVKIQLGNYDLKEISSTFVQDMSHLLFLSEGKDEDQESESQAMRPFVRAQTTSALLSSPQAERFKNPLKANSSKSVLKGEGTGMELYLAMNLITRLPAELWNWESLTVLSLRNNKISYLPPEVSKLRNLTELNVATNQLRFVPSELLSMNLTIVHLHPNPFLPNPNIASKRPSSETTQFGESRVPPLTELGLRRLLGPQKLSPSMFDRHPLNFDAERRHLPPKTLLETQYEIPLAIEGSENRPFDPKLKAILTTCCPRLVICNEKPVYEQSVEEGGPITGIGRCPNPSHNGTKIYICPAEQRFTWEKTLENGVQVGAPVPVRWRGCMWGCLNFLGPFDQEHDEVLLNGNMGTEDVFQVVDLGDGDLDFD